MYAKSAWGIVVCIIGAMNFGCAQSPQIIRGQTPADVASLPATLFHKAHLKNWHHQHPHQKWRHEDGTKKIEGSVYFYNRPCQHGSACSCGAHPTLHNQSPFAGFHHPPHHLTYEYTPPSNLVYPPANTPAAVVHYPYYTLKGPSDFYMQ